MDKPFTIRLANIADAKQILAVYAPFVTDSIISFEYEVPTLDDFENRLQTVAAEYPWLVVESGNEIVGYAYGGKHRGRTAYNWSVESTIYLAESVHGKGLARVIYISLLDCLRHLGYANAYAGITLPNPKSQKFHASMGFQPIGTFKNIGYKFGKWHDTHWMQKDLIKHALEPKKPIRMDELEDRSEINLILDQANAGLR